MQQFPFEVIHIESSPYSTYRIIDMNYENRPTRMLFGDDGSPQSGMALDDNPELLFDYNQRFLEMMMSQQPLRILVIGGGVMMLPKGALQQLPQSTIDVVEIDELLVELARNHFELPEDPRLHIHVTDGLEFVKSVDEPYDMIILDAFYGLTVPEHLVSPEAAQLYHQALTPQGVIAINIISEYKPGEPSLAHRLIAGFSPYFPHLSLYQSDPTDIRGRDQNLIFAASNAEVSFDYLQLENVIDLTSFPK